MSLTALLRKRRNVYGFLPKPVSDELLSGILEDAIRVPSAGFTQDFDLVVVRNRSTKKRLAEASREEEYVKSNSALSDFITTAPVLIVPCANKQRYEAKYGRGQASLVAHRCRLRIASASAGSIREGTGCFVSRSN